MSMCLIFIDCIRNGNHEMAEEPELPGPQDAPGEAAKEDGSPTEEAEEVEDDG